MALAGHCDDAGARPHRELDGEHANAATRPCDHDRLTGSRPHGPHRGHPRHAGDEQRPRYFPGDLSRLRCQVGRLDEHVLGVAGAVVGIADHLITNAYAFHAQADLLDHASEVRTLATGKGGGENLTDQAFTHLRFADIDTCGAHRYEHLAGAGCRTRYLAHVEDVDATVIVELHCLHQRVTLPSAHAL